MAAAALGCLGGGLCLPPRSPLLARRLPHPWPGLARGVLSRRPFAAAAAEVAPRSGGMGAGGGNDPTAIYIHIPFCRRRCFYCDFPIQVVGDKYASSPKVADGMEEYVELLERELAATPRDGGRPLETVFFGGGTPSLLPPHLLERILRAVDGTLGIAAAPEISMEIDPGTFDEERLASYVGLGVTRVSLGVQSFQQELLTACGRAHTAEDTARALDAVHKVRPQVWSLDLMGGLPHQTREQWQASLDAAVAAQPDHVSVYDLQVEDGTAFGKWYQPGESPLPSESAAADFYRMASASLATGGLEHYEVSNYAIPGAQCRHNLVYWRNQPYYALGVGAASYLGARRHSRPRRVAAYRKWVGELEERARAAGGGGWGLDGAYGETPVDSPEEQLLDTVMLGLRLAEGLDLRAVGARHGAGAAEAVASGLLGAERAGQAVGLDEGGAVVPLLPPPGGAGGATAARARLTDPEGFLVSNDVISSVFAALDPGEED